MAIIFVVNVQHYDELYNHSVAMKKSLQEHQCIEEKQGIAMKKMIHRENCMEVTSDYLLKFGSMGSIQSFLSKQQSISACFKMQVLELISKVPSMNASNSNFIHIPL